MEKKPYSQFNAENVLSNLEALMRYQVSRPTRAVCDLLSIFDWWTETLSYKQMSQMRTFLKTAIKLGYTGYVCFKVGASGCSNGMWAHKEESEDGYSPKGDFLYRSFTPDYTYWSAKIGSKSFPEAADLPYDACVRSSQLVAAINSVK